VLTRSAKIRGLAFCLALQAACASVPEPEPVKEPPPSEESSASVRPQLGNVKVSIPHYPTHLFVILAVDGVGHLTRLAPVDVPAGPHTLTVGVISTDWIGQSTTYETTISFVAVAARVYQLRGSMRGGEAVVWIVDEGSQEVVAGEPPVSGTDTP
jgi:hypothetical protein